MYVEHGHVLSEGIDRPIINIIPKLFNSFPVFLFTEEKGTGSMIYNINIYIYIYKICNSFIRTYLSGVKAFHKNAIGQIANAI
jgi:hypothetical protein